jgi:hypothetical protein
MHPLEPCCAACVNWNSAYMPSDYVVEASADLPVFNAGEHGFCTHGGAERGECIDRKEISGTYWESEKAGLITQHDSCCSEFKVRE